jgi:replicative DNA helicase
LYREGYYLEQKGEEDKNDSKTELSIAKHRNGPTGVVNLIFRKNTLEFLEESTATHV